MPSNAIYQIANSVRCQARSSELITAEIKISAWEKSESSWVRWWMAGSKSICGMNECTRHSSPKARQVEGAENAGKDGRNWRWWKYERAAAFPWQPQRTQPALEPLLGLRAMNEWRHWGGAQGIRWRSRLMIQVRLNMGRLTCATTRHFPSYFGALSNKYFIYSSNAALGTMD